MVVVCAMAFVMETACREVVTPSTARKHAAARNVMRRNGHETMSRHRGGQCRHAESRRTNQTRKRVVIERDRVCRVRGVGAASGAELRQVASRWGYTICRHTLKQWEEPHCSQALPAMLVVKCRLVAREAGNARGTAKAR